MKRTPIPYADGVPQLPPGTLVVYWNSPQGPRRLSRTRGEPFQLGHGAWVVKLEGHAGGWGLDNMAIQAPEVPPSDPSPAATRDTCLYLLIVKEDERRGRGMYWRANAKGYTDRLELAGLYNADEAAREVLNSDRTIAVPAGPILQAVALEHARQAEELRRLAQIAQFPRPPAESRRPEIPPVSRCTVDGHPLWDDSEGRGWRYGEEVAPVSDARPPVDLDELGAPWHGDPGHPDADLDD